jgi:hypothetical protein
VVGDASDVSMLSPLAPHLEQLLVFNCQVTTHAVVVERARSPARDDVEAGEVPARTAAVAHRH